MSNINYIKPRSWYHSALTDVIRHPGTRAFNTHFTDAEWTALKHSCNSPVIAFGDKPVHAPYRTKGGNNTFYCQKRIDGLKYDVHRLGYIYGCFIKEGVTDTFSMPRWTEILNPDMEVSHTLEGYIGSQRNFNYNHLTMESGFRNKSRCGCLFHYLKWASELTGSDLVSRYEEAQKVFDPEWIAENIDPTAFPPEEPTTYGSVTFAQQSCKHEPACVFWRVSWGPVPAKVGTINGLTS
mgnify:CR=1 FL=1